MESSSKINFTLKSENASFDFTLINEGEELTFKFEDIKEFPVKIYQLKIQFKELGKLDENFYMFKRVDRFIDIIKKCIQGDRYSVTFNEEENYVLFEIKNELFENGGAKIKIHEQEQGVDVKVESLTKTVAILRKEIQAIKFRETEKEEVALKSFKQSSFLKEEEKKMISNWINPNKVIRFNLLYTTEKDGDRSSTFHYYCDGIFPTLTVILDTSGRRFGGFTTQNWCQSCVGANYSRAPESFIFNLSTQQKYDLIDQLNTNAIYRHGSYGPTFGSGYAIYIADQCKSSNNSYCSKTSSYNIVNSNIFGANGQTNFQVSNYEVYQVIFE